MADAYIPRFRAIREAVGGTYDPDRRPGSSGQRYFSDVEYANPNMPQRIFDPEAEGYETQAAYDARFDTATDTATDAARATTRKQATGLQALNLSNLARQQRPAAQTLTDAGVREKLAMILDDSGNLTTERKQIDQGIGAMNQYNINPYRASDLMNVPLSDVNKMMSPYYTAYGETKPGGVADLYTLLQEYINGTKTQPYGTGEVQGMAQGGIASVAPQGQGYYLGGPTDGMADQIPATIDNRQPAALSDGEFVIPADVVSHLGNGNSNSGAQHLYGMMDKVRKARTGNSEQGRQIDANKFLA
jgi:hypothetical protein